MEHYTLATFHASMRSTCDDSDARNAETLKLLREFTGGHLLFDKVDVYDLLNTQLPDHLIVMARWSETVQEWFAGVIRVSDERIGPVFAMPCVDREAAFGLALAKADEMRREVMERGL